MIHHLTHDSIETRGCVASTTETTRSTISASSAPGELITGSPAINDPLPSFAPPIGHAFQQYLFDTFNRLGIGYAHEEPVTSCSAHSYDEAIPGAAAFIQDTGASFCEDQEADPSKTLEKGYTAEDVMSRRKRSLRQRSIIARTPPPSPVSPDTYPGWNVTFKWRPGHEEDTTCDQNTTCTDAVKMMLTSCEG